MSRPTEHLSGPQARGPVPRGWPLLLLVAAACHPNVVVTQPATGASGTGVDETRQPPTPTERLDAPLRETVPDAVALAPEALTVPADTPVVLPSVQTVLRADGARFTAIQASGDATACLFSTHGSTKARPGVGELAAALIATNTSVDDGAIASRATLNDFRVCTRLEAGGPRRALRLATVLTATNLLAGFEALRAGHVRRRSATADGPLGPGREALDREMLASLGKDGGPGHMGTAAEIDDVTVAEVSQFLSRTNVAATWHVVVLSPDRPQDVLADLVPAPSRAPATRTDALLLKRPTTSDHPRPRATTYVLHRADAVLAQIHGQVAWKSSASPAVSATHAWLIKERLRSLLLGIADLPTTHLSTEHSRPDHWAIRVELETKHGRVSRDVNALRRSLQTLQVAAPKSLRAHLRLAAANRLQLELAAANLTDSLQWFLPPLSTDGLPWWTHPSFAKGHATAPKSSTITMAVRTDFTRLEGPLVAPTGAASRPRTGRLVPLDTAAHYRPGRSLLPPEGGDADGH